MTKNTFKTQFEPPREHRRPIYLSQATMARLGCFR
jgi:hypothetical protein